MSATFVGANPRNNLRLEGTYAAVERQGADGVWTQIKTDADWDLVFQWKRVNGLTGTSDVTLSWDTAVLGAAAATYRLRYYGDAKAIGGKVTAFQGQSGAFRLV